MRLSEIKLIKIDKIADSRGILGVVDKIDKQLEIKRIYWLDKFTKDTTRGMHAHKALSQIIIQLRGESEIVFDDGFNSKKVLLNGELDYGFFVPPGIWRTILSKTDESLLIVLASAEFYTEDYIYDYAEFIDWKSSV